MKIYTKVVVDIGTGEVLEEESFNYTGPLVHCISFGGGGEKSESKPVPVNVWNKKQRELGDLLGERLQEMYSRGVPRYPGDLYTPTTDLEAAYLSGDTSAFAADLAKYRALGESTWQNALSRAGTPTFTPNTEMSEQYYQDFIKTPYMKEFAEVYEPGIRELYVGPNFHSSARVEAQREGYENLATTLGAKRAELFYQDELARREALESAAMREAQLGQLTPQMTAALSESALYGQSYIDQVAKERAALSREIEQEEKMAQFQRWLMGETMGGETPTQYDPYTQLMFQFLNLEPIVVAGASKSKGFNANFGFMA